MKQSQLTIAKAYCIRPLLTASLVLAITFTLSCSEMEDDDVPITGGSSSYQTLDGCPNAVTTPVNAEGVGSVTCDGQTYKTVKIGEQVWMAKNLNYDADGLQGQLAQRPLHPRLGG